MAIRNIGVVSGSRIGSDPDFPVAAEALGCHREIRIAPDSGA